MPLPNLTFFCELDADPLDALIDERIIASLKHMQARLSLGLPDLSPRRAAVVRRLNQAGIPLTAWLLLPKSEGYWLNLRNAPQAFQRYFAFKEWSREYGLKWSWIGLDIEPDMSEFEDLMKRNWRSVPRYLLRTFSSFELKRGLSAYRRLVHQMHEDGYCVETYQLPLIGDERKAHSSMLQRVLGLLNLPADREVWMLYTNRIRPHGAGMLASYADEAQAIAVGSTGGGVELEGATFQALNWDEFARDLRLAWNFRNDLYIFSLEGCADQGFLDRLESFIWDYPVILPETSMLRVDGWRRSLQSVLWLFSHAALLIGSAFGGFLVWKFIRYLIRRNTTSASSTTP